jgi:hypothetical protein
MTKLHIIGEFLKKKSLKNKKKFVIGLNCKILSFCHVTNMGVSTTEMNSNMSSILTNSKSADFIISMLYQMLTYCTLNAPQSVM